MLTDFFKNINQAFSKVNLNWNRVDFGNELGTSRFQVESRFLTVWLFQFPTATHGDQIWDPLSENGGSQT